MDPLFEGPGIRPVHQHFRIVIGFQDQQAAFLEMFLDQRGGKTQIRGDADLDSRGFDGKGTGVFRVVGGGKRGERQGTDPKKFSAADRNRGFDSADLRGCCGSSSGGHKNRQAISPGKNPDSLNMILVFMGNDDRGDVFRRQPPQSHPPFNFFSGKPGIQKDSGVIR